MCVPRMSLAEMKHSFSNNHKWIIYCEVYNARATLAQNHRSMEKKKVFVKTLKKITFLTKPILSSGNHPNTR